MLNVLASAPVRALSWAQTSQARDEGDGVVDEGSGGSGWKSDPRQDTGRAKKD